MESNIVQSELPNGIKVVTQKRQDTSAVAFRLFVRCGGRHEEDHLVGTSHALEHMMFKGTKKRSQQDLSRKMEGLGATFNALTSFEHTCFLFLSPFDTFFQVLEIFSDAILNSVLKPEEWEKERQVILEELKMKQNMPHAWVSHLLLTSMFNLQAGVIGAFETIANINVSDLKAHIQKWYRPKNIIISVAGNINHDEIIKACEKYFTLPTIDRDFEQPTIPKPVLPLVKYHQHKSNQVNIALGIPSYGLNSPKFYPLWILSNILGGKMSSRLFQEIREKRGLAYSVNSMAKSFSDGGILQVKASISMKNVKETLQLVLKELSQIKNECIADQELEEAKTHIRGMLRIQEQSDSFARLNGLNWMFRSQVISIEETLDLVSQVTAESILDVAQELFFSNNLAMAVIAERDIKGEIEENLIISENHS